MESLPMFRWLMTTAVLLAASPSLATTLPNRPVSQLDMARYAGQWHEIAHLPMFFERSCVSAVTATYTPRADGTIKVHNACRTKHGIKTVDGTARTDPGQPAELKVRFIPGSLSWLPDAWADYWVIAVDADYQWAVIGSPSRKYLWILARRPGMRHALFQTIIERARQQGYDVNKLMLMAPLD